jgi:hypothetical protein
MTDDSLASLSDVKLLRRLAARMMESARTDLQEEPTLGLQLLAECQTLADELKRRYPDGNFPDIDPAALKGYETD